VRDALLPESFQKTYIDWRSVDLVDERFRKEDVTPVWYRRPTYLIILGIIALILVILAYDVLFPAVQGPEPYIQPNP
jgi:hypothetical protein